MWAAESPSAAQSFSGACRLETRADGGEARRVSLLEAACDPALFARFRAGEPLDAEAVLAELFAGADGDAAREAGGFR